MTDESPMSLISSFQDLPDPRVAGRCEHKLIDIIVIAVCAVIADAETWVDVENFGKAKAEWLKTVLELPAGIPSHDTFGRFFALLDGAAFQQCFIRWVEGVFRVTKGQVVAMDGKTSRGSQDHPNGKKALHLVNAWATLNGIALGQWATAEKSNEITAIPQLLRVLDVSGCIVTLDAMGTQTTIAQAIRAEKADYVLPVKANQGHLLQDLQDWFAYAELVNFAEMPMTYAKTVNKQHGRIEIRQCWALSDPLAFEYIRHYQGWTDLQSIVRIQRERRSANKTETETGYYITSLAPLADLILQATRSHWAVENSLHWVLDVTFREDDARMRSGYAPQNMALLRQLALNILKKDPSKGSLRTKRYKAALDTTFLETLLLQI